MFKQGDSQINRNERLLFLTNFTAKCGWIFILTQENACSQRFQFKTNRKNICSSKNCTMDFCISPPFRRSTYFYLAITEILKVFNALTLKPVFSKPKTFFIKLDYRFLVQCATIKNVTFPYKFALTKANFKTNRMRSTRWNYHKQRSSATNYISFLKV